jgi:hypothetical protein
MNETRRKGLARIAAVVAVTVGAVYLFQLAGLALATRQARQVEADQRAEVVRLATQVGALQTATFDAGTDDYVKRWAREQRKWGQTGDHVLVPVTPGAESAGQNAATPTPAENPLGRLWHWLNRR